MSSQRGPSLELFSLVQDGSALPASLLHGIEQSIKVYLSICQLQWAVWWALIGQAFLCFSSWLGYYSSYRRQPIKQFILGNKLLLLLKQIFLYIFITLNSCYEINSYLVSHIVCSLVQCEIPKDQIYHYSSKRRLASSLPARWNANPSFCSWIWAWVFKSLGTFFHLGFTSPACLPTTFKGVVCGCHQGCSGE